MNDEMKCRVLCIDDDRATREMMNVLLSTFGHRVFMAENGLDALEMMAEERFDVVISDVDMPVMDGLSLYKKIEESLPHIMDRFIFITGSDDKEVISFIREKGCRYLPKPFKVAELLDATEDVISRTTMSVKAIEAPVSTRAFERVSFSSLCIMDILPINAETVDISRHGMKIKYLYEPLTKGQKGRLVIPGLEMPVDVTVVWSKIIDREAVSGLVSDSVIPLSKLGVPASCKDI